MFDVIVLICVRVLVVLFIINIIVNIVEKGREFVNVILKIILILGILRRLYFGGNYYIYVFIY